MSERPFEYLPLQEILLAATKYCSSTLLSPIVLQYLRVMPRPKQKITESGKSEAIHGHSFMIGIPLGSESFK